MNLQGGQAFPAGPPCFLSWLDLVNGFLLRLPLIFLWGFGGVLPMRLSTSSRRLAISSSFRAVSDMFQSAKLKLNRADHHILDLETQFTEFTNSDPYALAVSNDGGETILRLNFRKTIPKQWALIIGDAVHNMRTALDHMTWDLVGRDGGTQDRHVKFPTGDSRTSFRATCNGIKTPSQSVKDLLKTTEAFPGGKGDTLYSLHQLDIADKHITLTPVVQSAKVSKYVIYNADGSPKSRWIDTTFIVHGDTGHMNISGVPPGGYVEFENNAKVTPTIVLDKANPKGAYFNVLSMLREFFLKTRKTIDQIDLATRDNSLFR